MLQNVDLHKMRIIFSKVLLWLKVHSDNESSPERILISYVLRMTGDTFCLEGYIFSLDKNKFGFYSYISYQNAGRKDNTRLGNQFTETDSAKRRGSNSSVDSRWGKDKITNIFQCSTTFSMS